MLLVGAHYDSVSTTPGADDNASAVAAMLGCAKICSEMPSPPAIGFVAFNREEDGLAGSRDFVRQYLPAAGFTVSSAHILEMVGYASHQPGSQRLPEKLPIRVPDIGNFLALLANRDSGREADAVLSTARSYLPDFPVLSLKVSLGLERIFPVLARSDHAPFWDARIPATMWTDTSEFRNPNYHMPSDTPDTLDYTFLANVTKLLSAHVISSAHPPPPGGTPR
jgi:Zn-dependent M28 family amino/carboxypeptidase